MSLLSVPSLLYILAVTSAMVATGAPVKLLARQSNCDTSSAVPFLRSYSSGGSNHFYTTNYNELGAATTDDGYKYEGEEGYVFREPGASLTLFYRLYQPKLVDHFYTTSQAEANNAIISDGYNDEGSSSYVYTSQVCGSIPLYRLYSSGAVDHFYTTDEAERENAINNLGYSDEGIAAYVLPNPYNISAV